PPPPPVAESVEQPVLDDPAYFFPDEPATREEPAAELTLDDALPADESPYREEPTQPWPESIPVVDEVPEQKPGLFGRLFGRKTKAVESPAAERVESDIAEQVEEAFAAADAEFDARDTGADAAEPEVYASVDDALPMVESASPFAPPVVPAEPVEAFEAFEAVESVEAPPATPARASSSDLFFGDTIDPGDVQPSIEPIPLEEYDARPTVETEARATLQTAPLDDASTDEFVQPVPPEVDAAAEAERPPFFVPKFRSFYNEIVLYKHQKSEFTAGFATAIVDYTSDLTPDHAAQALSKRLQEILELQHAEALWMGGEASARYPDAQYAMAVLADEMFTHMEWPGQPSWPQYLLEPKLFKTRAADVEFFKRVDKLLKEERAHPTPAARDLARLYLLVLASGFRGKYRVPNLRRPLADYRRALYEFVYGGDALMLYGSERRIFPEATQRTLESRAVSRFSMLQQWAAALILLLVGYTLIANFAWKSVSADLADVTARVEAANRTSSSDGAWGRVVEDSIR
ncbi:MAG: DotU family type IV/VI secretion system protein, partial [Gemmatimonadaceae bacterium]